MAMPQTILVLNSGSSSIKFGIFDSSEEKPAMLFRGAIEHIGEQPGLEANAASVASVLDRSWSSPQSEEELIDAILGWLDDEELTLGLSAVGHRIVHGGSEFVQPTLLTELSVVEIARLTPLAPLHQERCLSPARTLMKLRPG